MEYKKKQRKEDIGNVNIFVRKYKLALFLIVCIVVFVLLSSSQVYAEDNSLQGINCEQSVEDILKQAEAICAARYPGGGRDGSRDRWFCVIGLTSSCSFDEAVTDAIKNCDTFCKNQHGSGWRGVIENPDDPADCNCKLTKEGCENKCQKGDVRAHYKYINSEQKCYCSCTGKLLKWDINTEKCECVSNAEPNGGECKCESGYELDVWGKKCDSIYFCGDENCTGDENINNCPEDCTPKKIPPVITFPAYDPDYNYCGPDHLFSVPRTTSSGADFNFACYEHDKCYEECNKPGNEQVKCDQRWRNSMDASCDQAYTKMKGECDALSGFMCIFKPICAYSARKKRSGCRDLAAAYHTGTWAGAKIVGSYTCSKKAP